MVGPGQWVELGRCRGLQARVGRIGAEGKLQSVDSGRGTMLDCKVEVLSLSAQIEVGVAPGMQFRGSAQCLATALVACTLASVVHEGNRGTMVALLGPQEAEQGSNLAGDVLVDGVQAHKGVEDEEFWPQVGNGGAECLIVPR
jgi:hypothetical protein